MFNCVFAGSSILANGKQSFGFSFTDRTNDSCVTVFLMTIS